MPLKPNFGMNLFRSLQVNYVLKHLIREPRPKPPSGARDDWKLWEQVKDDLLKIWLGLFHHRTKFFSSSFIALGSTLVI